MRVQTSTRGFLVLQIGASRRQSADQVILAALAAMQRVERRQVAAAEARAIKDDPAVLLAFRRSSTTWRRCMRGEVYRLPPRGKGHKQKGRRYAVVVQPDWLTLSTWIVAFTSTIAPETSFRPSAVVAADLGHV